MTIESQEIKNNENEISLKELILMVQEWFRYLFSKWVVILIFGLLGGLLGFFYAKSKNPVYTATTTFVLEDEKGGGGLGNLAGLASMAGVDLGSSGGGIFQGDNIFELYKSRKMLVQTLLSRVYFDGKSQLLIQRYVDVNNLKKSWSNKPGLVKLKFDVVRASGDASAPKSDRLRDSVLTNIVGDIAKNYLFVSKPDKKLSIIKVEVKSKDETFAKLFNEALVKNVNDFYVRTKTKKSLQNIQILEKKRDSVKQVMNGAIYSAVEVTDATPNLNPTRQVQRVAPAQRAQFSAETNKAILTSLVQNLEMSKLALMKDTPLLQVIDQPVYPLNVEKFGKVKGLAIGGILTGFLVILGLTLQRFFKQINNNNQIK